jgi:hypothetical protein
MHGERKRKIGVGLGQAKGKGGRERERCIGRKGTGGEGQENYFSKKFGLSPFV